MSKQTIAVDIDDVLSTHAADFIAYCNQRWGTRLTVDDYDEDWQNMWGVDIKERDRRAREVHGSGIVNHYGHREEALTVLKKLSKKYRLVIVTSRQRVIMTETADWINNYFQGVFEEIHHAGIWDDYNEDAPKATKAEICRQIGADYLIDDQPKHCIAAANAGLKTLLFGDYAWNRAVTKQPGVTRVHTWQEVAEYFDARG